MFPLKIRFKRIIVQGSISSEGVFEMAIPGSIGNDQDLFGFIMLGAYQDSRPSSMGQAKRLRLSWMDLYILGIYLFIAMPLPQVCRWLTGGFAYPTQTWKAYASAVQTNGWDQAYIEWADVPRHYFEGASSCS